MKDAEKEITALKEKNKKLEEEAHATFLGAYDLNEKIKKLNKEISDALDVLNPNMRSSGLVDACIQRAQAYISERDNCEECEKLLAEISDFLSNCFAPVTGRHLELMNKIDKMLGKK